MSVFNSLPPDSQIKFAIQYRGLDLGKIRDPQEREQYVRIKRAVALEKIDFEAEYDEAMERMSMSGG